MVDSVSRGLWTRGPTAFNPHMGKVLLLCNAFSRIAWRPRAVSTGVEPTHFFVVPHFRPRTGATSPKKALGFSGGLAGLFARGADFPDRPLAAGGTAGDTLEPRGRPCADMGGEGPADLVVAHEG